MFIPLLRTPLARYVPLKASSQLTSRVFPVSAALTRSYSAATKTKTKAKAATKPKTKAKAKAVEPAKAKRGKESKTDGRKKKRESPDLLEFVHLVDFCFFASLAIQSPPRQPTNSFIRFSSHYYRTHEIKQPIAVVAGDIKRAYDKLTPEEKEVCSPVDFFCFKLVKQRSLFFFSASLRNTFLPNKNKKTIKQGERSGWKRRRTPSTKPN
jgi:hypothetical protein